MRSAHVVKGKGTGPALSATGNKLSRALHSRRDDVLLPRIRHPLCRTSYTIVNVEFVDDEECGGVNGFGGVSAEGGGVINEMAMHVGRRPDSSYLYSFFFQGGYS